VRVDNIAGGRNNPVMFSTAAAVALMALVLGQAAPRVDPPPASGPWRLLGAAVIAPQGKQLHFFRTAMDPKVLGVVASSSSPQPIRVHWWTYCEFESDDATTEEHQETITGVHSVVAYPPVLAGATLCYVAVTARVAGARVAAAVFTY
jgi:hypothetical protein